MSGGATVRMDHEKLPREQNLQLEKSRDKSIGQVSENSASTYRQQFVYFW
jgi:hypothetical protein